MLKSTGIVRRVDDLGRVVLPVELRRTLGLDEGSAMEIFTEGETVLLRRYSPLCVFCGQGGHLVQHRGKQICGTCCRALNQAGQRSGEVTA